MKQYRTWSPRQPYLLPPSPTEWLPEDHLVYFVLDVVDELDLSAITRVVQAKDRRGTRPYAPELMVALLLYGYSVGVFSSRKLEKATYEDVGFRVLSGGCHPDHARISEFRRIHLDALAGLFLQVLHLCRKAGLVRLGHVALDGTKIQGNASKHKAMSYGRMKQMESRLKEEIAELLKRAEAADREEDARFGEGVRGDELPQELSRREQRLAKLREAKAELEAEAKAARATHLRELAAQNREKSEDEGLPERERRYAATRAERQQAQARDLDDDDPKGPPVSASGLPLHSPQTTAEGEPHDKAQRNFTDPESRLLESHGAFVQGYNCQVAVDDARQIIVAQAVSNLSPDNGNLVPMLDETIQNCGQAPAVMSADAGYWAQGVSIEAAERGTETLISTERRKAYALDKTVTLGPAPKDATEIEAMRHTMRTERGRELYRRRKAIVEPVHGQQKEARGFRRFLLRGLHKASSEFAMLCTGHNLLKLYRADQAA